MTKSRSKKVDLKPAVGYVEEVTLVTNGWEECISNHKRGARTVGILNVGDLIITGNCNVMNYTTTNMITWGSYSVHECPKCNKKHISDYPKTKTEVTGIQEKTTTTIYKDGKEMARIVEYGYPIKKITKKTTTKIKYEDEVETTITEEPK